MRVFKTPHRLNKELLHKILLRAKKEEYFAYFNPNSHADTLYGPFEHFIAIGKKSLLKTSENSFEQLRLKLAENTSYLVGYFSYELKNEAEALASQNPATIGCSHLEFFEPETLIFFLNGGMEIHSQGDPESVLDQVLQEPATESKNSSRPMVKSRTSKEEYIRNCEKIKKDIVDGEYYELNYCIEFYAENCEIDPIDRYFRLNDLSPMPFSCLCRFGDIYVICASPERFLKRQGNKLVSQPIKGTIRRGKDDSEDQHLKNLLRNSEKEISENMMIVDLMRNDLSRSSIPGTVKVDEFFGIYTFKQVHQMISTVSSVKKDTVDNALAIKNAFPMGSMTGAPKIRVMQAIDDFEASRRGIYSGAIGYFKPDQDFDFNVVIRSIIYDSKKKTLSFHVGSAITYDANPEYEYEECLLKANSMMKILSSD